MQRSCLFICSVLGTQPISCAICVSVAICINFHRKKKKKKKTREYGKRLVVSVEQATITQNFPVSRKVIKTLRSLTIARITTSIFLGVRAE